MGEEEAAPVPFAPTGKHFCVKCLTETRAEEYFSNDHICNACVNAGESFPLGSTPPNYE